MYEDYLFNIYFHKDLSGLSDYQESGCLIIIEVASPDSNVIFNHLFPQSGVSCNILSMIPTLHTITWSQLMI